MLLHGTGRRTATILTCLATLCTFAVAPTAAASAGAAYYVAPDGSDDASGTKDSPFRTIWFGMEQLQAGDTLYVRGGTYTERIGMDRQVAAGRSDARITVRNYPGERPVVKGGFDTGNFAMGDYWTLDGINFTWDGKYGANVALVRVLDGTGWEIRNSEIWGNRSYTALRVLSTQANEPADWSLVGNCIHTTHSTNGFNNDHNVYITNGLDAQPGRIERNIIFGAPNGSNIKVGAGTTSGGASNVVIRHNTLSHAMSNVLVPWETENITIEQNLLGPIDPPSSDKFWYPNLRGYENTGHGNVARNNAAFGAHQFIDNRGSTTGIADGGGNRFPATPQLDGDGACSAFYPTKSSYRSYGAYAPVSSGDPIERVSGAGRVETSIAISKSARPSGGAENVVIARANTYPDALAGGPLAAALGAPILLSGSEQLHPETQEEIQRLGASKAVLLGGRSALSEQVRKDLEAINVSVHRIEGGDRFATAAQVAAELAKLTGTDVENPYVVEGQDADLNRGWPDAVAVGFLAAQQKRPILLVTTETLPGATETALQDLSVQRATIVGGTASVSDSVAKAIDRSAGSVGRIAGDSRYHTSRLVAEAALKAGAKAGRPWFATGAAFPDALAAGPAVAKDGGVLLLVPGNTTFPNGEATDWLDRFDDSIGHLRLIGGPAAVSYGIEDKARHQLLFE